MQAADRRVAALWLGLLAFFVYGSWAPAALQPRDLAEAWQGFLALPGPDPMRASRTDLAVNLLLPVPLAFGAAYLLAARWPALGRWWPALLPLPALLALSVGVEFGQVFFPPRTPSWTDVAAQALGATLGLAAFGVWGGRARALAAELSSRLPVARRVERWLLVYALLLVAWQLMPLDLTLSPVELYRKWRDGRVLLVPFAALPSSPAELLYAIGSELLLWMPVGALWWLTLRRPGLSGLAWRGLAAAGALEAAQLLVLSRVSDVTDVLLGAAGVVLGAALARAVGPWRRWPAERRRRSLGVALALWAAAAVAILWLPFGFEPARWWGEGAGARWHELLTRAPFATYLGRTEFGALSELLRKLLVFLPGGLLLALRAEPAPILAGSVASSAAGAVAGSAAGSAAWPPAWRALAPLALLALVLELGQLALPGKVADLTDAALGVLGAWAGWRLGRAVLAAPAADASALDAVGSSRGRAAPGSAGSAALAGSGGSGASAGPKDAGRGRPRARSRPLDADLVRWPALAAAVGLLTAAVWLAARLPGVPYNVARLVPAGVEGVFAALGVALALAWIVVAPAALLPERRRALRPRLPLALLLHGALAFAVLRAAVPLEMLHKIVGTPVFARGGLAWAAPLEDLLRYLALHAALMLPLVLALWLVRTATAPRALADLLWALGWAVLLFGPVHGVVVVAAGTDNLVELMAGGGGVGASLALGAGVAALATAGSALAAAWGAGGAGRGAWRRGPLVVLAVVAALLAPLGFVLGLEDLLVKYDRAFSAAQFLLSAGRDAYATGPELLLRAVLALAGAVALVALLQAPAWRALARATAGGTPAPALASTGRPRARPAGS